MTADSAPEAAAPAPASANFFATALARIKAAVSGILPGRRGHTGAAADTAAAEEPAEAAARAEGEPGEAEEVEAPALAGQARRAIPWRMALLFVLVLLVGVALGALFSYGLFAEKLSEQGKKLAEQGGRLVTLERDNERIKKAESEYQTVLAETQKQLADTQRSLVKATSWRMAKCAENDTECLAKYAPPAARAPVASRRVAPANTAEQLGGTCDISTSNLQEGLARCLGTDKR